MANAPPAAARTPATDATTLFALLLLADVLAEVLDEPEAEPDAVAEEPEVSVGVADGGGYVEPTGLTSNSWEVA